MRVEIFDGREPSSGARPLARALTMPLRSLLKGVVADDKLEITTTEALLADFERPN